MKKKVAKRQRKTKYDPACVFDVYDMSRAGASDNKIASALNVLPKTFTKWCDRFPRLKQAIDRGRENSLAAARGDTLVDYVYKRLPRRLQRLYSELVRVARDHDEINPVRRIEKILAGKGERTRQTLFVHAYVMAAFDKNKALGLVGISNKVFKRWLEDPDFQDLFLGVQDIRKDWIEGSLFNMARQGNAAITMFLAKTQLADRGYNPAQKVQHSGSVVHGHLNIDAILENMSVAAQAELLESIKKVKALPEHTDENQEEVQDAEFKEVANPV